MRKAVFEFKFLTPALLAGADQQTAEMRIPSIRGASRWWTRTLLGDDCEQEYFGCVNGNRGNSSSVILRLLGTNRAEPVKSQNAQSLAGSKYDYFLWPFRENTRGILPAESRFRVSCTVKKGREELDDRIIKAFLLFGAMGTRSRRAYGSVWPVSATFDGEEWKIPTTSRELTDEADQWFSENGTLFKLSGPKKSYKEAVSECSALLKNFRCGKTMNGVEASDWGKNDHDLIKNRSGQVFRAALGMPLVQIYRSSKSSLAYSIDGIDRLASPLLLKVAYLDGGYVPLMLVIRKYVPRDGTKVLLKINRRPDGSVSFSHELLDVMCDIENMRYFAPEATLLSDWVVEE